MWLQCFNRRQCISLFLLLMTASPMQMAAIAANSKDVLASSWSSRGSRTSSTSSSSNSDGNNINDVSNWAAKNFYGNGNLLPNIEAREMAPEFVDMAFNFPPYPLNKNKHWRSDKYLKKLAQVHRTWLQSPAERSRTKLTKRGPQPYWPMGWNDYMLQSNMANNYYQRKREPSSRFKPSISAGVMTNLGDFFKQLKANVHYAEHSQHQLGEEESQLLEGVHPHQQMIIDDVDDDDDDDGDGDNAANGGFYDSGQPHDRKGSMLLSYRPSQKIRSLVSRNPNGYRGSQFIDPSYMWLGLGK